MLTARAPYLTIDANPKDQLRRLRSGLIDFEDLGFASAISDSPMEYARRQLSYLQELVKDEPIWSEYGREASGVFIKEYYLRTLLMAANENLWDKLDMDAFYPFFCDMQKVIREVFPYWIDNDYLYGLGRTRLNILKSVNIDITEANNLGVLLQDVALLGLPPMVSVIMTSQNQGEKVLEALPKILNQTYDSLEVVLVDAGSTDDTKKVADVFGDTKIKYVRIEENNRAKALNAGIENASCQIIAFANCNDTWEDRKIELQMKELLKHTETSFCYSASKFYDKAGRKSSLPKENLSMVRKEGFIYPELLKQNMMGSSALVVKRECIDVIGGFNEALSHFEDWEFVLRLAKFYDASFVKESLFETYEDEDSLVTLGEAREAVAGFYEGFQKDRVLFTVEGEAI